MTVTSLDGEETILCVFTARISAPCEHDLRVDLTVDGDDVCIVKPDAFPVVRVTTPFSTVIRGLLDGNYPVFGRIHHVGTLTLVSVRLPSL